MKLPDCVSQEVTSLLKLIDKVTLLGPAVRAAEQALAESGLPFCDFERITVWSGDGSTPYVAAHMTFDNFRQVGQFGKALRKRGFHLCNQTDGDTYKVINYTGPITLFASFSGINGCKYVKVGEKTKPVYELQCA